LRGSRGGASGAACHSQRARRFHVEFKIDGDLGEAPSKNANQNLQNDAFKGVRGTESALKGSFVQKGPRWKFSSTSAMLKLCVALDEVDPNG